jgi:adenosylcobinamide-GDP ribazoletransferase
MKKLITAFFMSWGMFCAIPCPYRKWDNTLRPLMITLLPLLWLLFGALWLAAALLLRLAGIVNLFGAAVLTVMPWVLAGFIHLVGFYGLQRRHNVKTGFTGKAENIKGLACGSLRRHLPDGAFAAYFSLFASWDWEKLLPLLFIPSASRCLLRHSGQFTEAYGAEQLRRSFS